MLFEGKRKSLRYIHIWASGASGNITAHTHNATCAMDLCITVMMAIQRTVNILYDAHVPRNDAIRRTFSARKNSMYVRPIHFGPNSFTLIYITPTMRELDQPLHRWHLICQALPGYLIKFAQISRAATDDPSDEAHVRCIKMAASPIQLQLEWHIQRLTCTAQTIKMFFHSNRGESRRRFTCPGIWCVRHVVSARGERCLCAQDIGGEKKAFLCAHTYNEKSAVAN